MDARVTDYSVAEAKARFSELLARAEAGEEIVIRRHGKPVAKLAPTTAGPTVEERRRGREAWDAYRAEHPATLGPDLTPKDLIEEGRRF